MSTALHDDVANGMFRRMKEGGFDFARFHPIEFYALFPDQQRALAAKSSFQGESLHAQISERDDGVWHLQVSKVMFATSDGIDNFEQDLQSVVLPLGGKLDGWGITQEASAL